MGNSLYVDKYGVRYFHLPGNLSSNRLILRHRGDDKAPRYVILPRRWPTSHFQKSASPRPIVLFVRFLPSRDPCHLTLTFYSVTISFTVLGAIMDVVPVLPVFRTVFTGPSLALSTIMTCKVFRDVVLGCIMDVNNTQSIPMTVITTYDLVFERESETQKSSSARPLLRTRTLLTRTTFELFCLPIALLAICTANAMHIKRI